MGADPVAMMKRRAVTLVLPTSRKRGATNCALPSSTWTPRPWNRSTESCGSMAAMAPRMCS